MSNQVFWNDVFGLNAQNDLRMAKKRHALTDFRGRLSAKVGKNGRLSAKNCGRLFYGRKKIKKNFQHAIIHGKGAYFEVNVYLCTRIET